MGVGGGVVGVDMAVDKKEKKRKRKIKFKFKV